MKKLNFRKQYWAYAVLAAVCAGFIYTPQIAEAKFGKGETTSVFANGDEAKFIGEHKWYVVGQSNAGDPTQNIITLFAKESWGKTTFDEGVDYDTSALKVFLEGENCYGSLTDGSTEKTAIKNTDFGHFYVPSAEELVSGGNLNQTGGGTFGLTADGGLKLPDNSDTDTKNYWTRSSGTESGTVKIYNSYYGQLGQMLSTLEFYVRPVIQVSQAAAGSTLTGGAESGSYFSAKGGITSGTAFKGEASSGDVVKYEILKNDNTAVAGPSLTTNGTLVLDGSKITVAHGAAPDGFAVAAVLVNENDVVMASDSTFATIDGKIDYIATLADGIGDLNEVSNATYGLKIFGVNTTASAEKATQLGAGVINGIQKTDTGLNLTIGKLNDTTIYNAGFEVISLSNGAGVTLAGDASNAITVTGDTGKINLAGKTLSGTITNDSSTLEIAGGEAGKINGIVGANGTTVIKSGNVESTGAIANKVTVQNNASLSVGAANLQNEVTNNGTVNLADGTLSKKVTGGVLNIKGNVSSNAENIAGTTNTVDTGKILTVTGTTEGSSTTGILAKAVGGAGKIVIDGTITAMDSIATEGGITVNASMSLDIKASNVGADVANSGTVNLIDDDATLSKKVSGGILNIKGNVTSNAENIAGTTNTVDTGKILTVTGTTEGSSTTGILAKAVGGAGKIVINGAITAQDTISTTGGITINSGKNLVIAADKVGADITNNGTVKLGAGDLNKNINGGIVVVGIKDGDSEEVEFKPSQLTNISKIEISEANDTLKFNADVDATYNNIIGNQGKLAIEGSKTITLNDTSLELQSISIDTAALQIPASLLLTGDVGTWDVIDGKQNFVTFSNNAGLNLDLNGAHYKLSDLNKIKTTGSLQNKNVTLVNGVLDLDGTEKLSTEADGGVIENGTVAVHDATDGGKVADKISVAEKYVMVGKSDDNYQTPATLDAVTISQTPGTNNFVAKGLQIIPSGSSATFNVTSNSQVVLAGGTDNNGNISTPLVKAVLDGTDYKSEALDTKVVIDPTSTLQVGVDSGNATTQGMVINELDLGGGGILNVKKTYLKVSNVTSSGGKIVIDPSYTENSDKTILNAETTLVQDGSVLNIGDMPVEKMKTAASEWGKSVTDTLGGGFTMNSGAMVGLGSAVAMPSSGKLWLTNNGSTHSEQVYFGADSMLVVNVPTAHAESDFNGGTVQGILYNVASLGSAGSASIYLDGALEESKYYVIVSGDATVGATIINGDGKQTVWDADHIYTSDATLELVPVADPDAMLGIDIGYFRNMIVLKATEGDILMSEPALNSYHPIMEKMVDAPAGDDLNKMYADMKNVYRKNHKAGIDAMDSLMGLNSTSSMMRSGIVAANLMSQTTLDHVSLMERSSLNPNYGRSRYADGLRNTVAARDIFEPEYVDVGRSSAVMPVPSRQYTPSKQQNYIAKSYSGKSYSEKSYSEKSYKAELPKHYHSSYGSSYNDEDKKVWAEYIHSKETTDGMAVTGNGDNSTSGAVVGFDLWSGDHSFGGVSVAYSQTDVNNSASSTVTKNDIDTYGVGIYTRHDYSHCSMIFDAGYNYSKNDIKQEQNFGHNFEITGKPKVQIYDAGLRYEHSSHVSDKAAFVPYVGVRYTMVDPDSYCTNIGFKYKSKEKDIVSVPLGIRLSFNLYGNGFMVKPYLDFGYQWNFGQKDWKQTVMYDDVMSTLKYDVMDSNSHFINGGVQVYASNFNFGAGYRHSKSSHTKNNKWTINANWDL